MNSPEMAVSDGDAVAVDAPAKKTRNTRHWKAIAKAAERLAGERLDAERIAVQELEICRAALRAEERESTRLRLAALAILLAFALSLFFNLRLVFA